jgi:hypothetical protein
MTGRTLTMTRMGDFYEFFNDDAVIVARELAVQLLRDRAQRRIFPASRIQSNSLMPTLAESGSVFQLAAGVNLIVSVIISDFDKAREQIAELILRKIREFIPDFSVGERSRRQVIRFLFRFTPGLRFAQIWTRFLIAWSIAMAAISLFALYDATLEPGRNISVVKFRLFFGVTLVGSPILYLTQGLFLRKLSYVLAERAVRDEKHANEMVEMFDMDRSHDALLHEIDQVLSESIMIAEEEKWRMRWHKLQRAWYRLLRLIGR